MKFSVFELADYFGRMLHHMLKYGAWAGLIPALGYLVRISWSDKGLLTEFLMLALLASCAATGFWLRKQMESAAHVAVEAEDQAIGPEAVLTDRENQILRQLLSDKPNAVIADELCISPNTLKTHIRNIYGKTGVVNRKELMLKMLIKNQNHP